MSWVGINVRNQDGRSGVIRRDYEGFLHRSLAIHVEGGGQESVQLNCDGPDSGSTGWEWTLEAQSKGAKWYPLGDHSVGPSCG